ncbi:MAG: TonB-dependent receptor, partial [Sphingomonas bacterium]|nr:TonB-dependent receptor [Sphingomonas bacterium]
MNGIHYSIGKGVARKATLRSTTAILCACAMAAAAQAQPAPVNAAPAAGTSGADAPDASAVNNAETGAPAQTGLADIVVTASKRPETLQRAALSVTAVGSAAIEARGITDASQLTGLAPSVQFQPSFLLLTYIRGVGNYSSQPAVDQSIAYNVDGIYVDRPYAMPNILFDLERIELLRGPQGTLQGRNSTGGSVNLITARPTMDFQSKVSFSAGNYSLLTTEGMINVPLAPNVALRISAASTDHDGYFKNGFGDANTLGMRARLLARPTSRLEILATVEYSRRD